MSKLILNTIIMTLGILFTFSSSDAQYLKNPSFEEHPENVYPLNICPNHYENPPEPGYKNSQFMLCLGFCNNTTAWPPSWYCNDFPGGWYWCTNYGSVDYYHLKGLNNAKSPDVKVIGNDEGHSEKRYPYGYEINDYINDSAFVGIRLIATSGYEYSSSNPDGTNYLSYKEYFQSKLLQPLTHGTYHLKFFVSRSKYSHVTTQIGALFSSYAIVNPFDNKPQIQINHNLVTNNNFPYIYANNPQIKSNVPLIQTADSNGYGGWQLIEGNFIVPEDSVYNYITIGNFQIDRDLINDIKSNPVSVPYEAYASQGIHLYYFIDRLSLEMINQTYCLCDPDLFDIHIEKNNTTIDSNQCCYLYNVHIPIIDTTKVVAPICELSKFQIIRGSEVIVEKTAPSGENLNGILHSGSFCLDKFDKTNNSFNILFYKRINGTDSLISQCSRTITLNCKCDCSDFYSKPYPDKKMKFYTNQVVSNDPYTCCWEIIMENPISDFYRSTNGSDSTSCEYDLTGLNLLTIENPSGSYTATSGEFTLEGTGNGDLGYWKAPSNFKIKPGDKVMIGKICGTNHPPFNSTNSTISFAFSSSYSWDNTCGDTVLNAKLYCDTAVDCCDLFKIKAVNIPDFNKLSAFGDLYSIFLDVKNNPNCFLNDTLLVTLTDTTSGYNYNQVNIPNISSGSYLLESFYYIFDSPKTLCLTIINLNTGDTCTKCITLTPGVLPAKIDKEGDPGFKNDNELRINSNTIQSPANIDDRRKK